MVKNTLNTSPLAMYIDGYVIYNILTLCMYNFLCVTVSMKMTKHLLKHVGGLTCTNNF